VVQEVNNIVLEREEPFTEAHVTYVEGDQRQGKTIFAVKTLTQVYYKDCARIFFKERYNLDVEVKSYNRKNRVVKIKYQDEIKYLKIPEDYKLHSPMKIFSNIHIYGIPMVYIDSKERLLEWLKSGFISNGWLLVDEAHRWIGARNSMTSIGKELQGEMFQIAKSMLDLIIVSHLPGLIDWSVRTIPTKRINIERYEKSTHRVYYTIREKGVSHTGEYSFDATDYFANYDPNEKVRA
jgi:hypothetical protein